MDSDANAPVIDVLAERPSEHAATVGSLFTGMGQRAVPRHKDIPPAPRGPKRHSGVPNKHFPSGFGKLIPLELDPPLKLPSLEHYYPRSTRHA